MLADSIRKRILAACLQRVSAITIDNGFRTDAGLTVTVGYVPKLGPGDPVAAIAILPRDQSPTFQAEHVRAPMPVTFAAVANASPNLSEAWFVAEDVLSDLQRAIEADEDADRTLGVLSPGNDFQVGDTRTFEREAGTDIVAIEQDYVFPIIRVWGHPESRR